MYVRITRVQSAPDRVDDNVETFKTTALPRVRSLPGYAGSSLGVNRETGDSQVATFWDSEEALKASAGAAASIRSDSVQAGGGQVTSVDEYEVAIMERADAPTTPAFLRVIRGQADPARLDALVQAARDEALPVLRTLRGFRALAVAVDRQSGRAVVTGVWKTAEDREASDSALAEIRTRVFAQAGVSQPEISRYEVAAVEFVGVGAQTG